ncbi:hypothetical protein [Nocardia sp. bgisy118]
MWAEIGKTVRKAIGDWGSTWRMCICVFALTAAAAVLIWVASL